MCTKLEQIFKILLVKFFGDFFEILHLDLVSAAAAAEANRPHYTVSKKPDHYD